MHDVLSRHRDEPKAICLRYGVARRTAHGSMMRDDSTDGSDVDLLVEFSAGTPVSLLDLGGMQQECLDVPGREDDWKTPGFLSRYFRDDVILKATVLYAA